MSWTVPSWDPFTWEDEQTGGTPLDATDLNEEETTLHDFAIAIGTNLASWVAANFDSAGAAADAISSFAPDASTVSLDPTGFVNTTSRDVLDVLADFDDAITALQNEVAQGVGFVDYNTVTKTWPARGTIFGMYIWRGPGEWIDGGWTADTAYDVGDSWDHAGTPYYVVTAYTSGSTFGTTDTSKTVTYAPAAQDWIALS